MNSLLKETDSFLSSLQATTQVSKTNYWIYVAAALLVSIIFSFLLRGFIDFLLNLTLARFLREDKDALLKKMVAPIQLLCAVSIFFVFYLAIDIHKDVQDTLVFGFKAAAFLSVTYFLYRILDLIFEKAIVEHKALTSKSGLILPLGRRVAKSVLVVTALLFFLAQFGIDVSSLLVGLGIGSLAIALAAQKILENLFGGAVLSLDQPFRVGDYCKCGDVLGTIEEIGIRSTRIRTLDRTLVSIPNANLSQMTIENYHEREKIRLYHIFRLSLETTSEQVELVLKKIISLLHQGDSFYTDIYRIRLIGFSELGYEIEIYAFAKTTEWSQFAAMREELFLEIFNFLERENIKIAVPERKIRN